MERSNPTLVLENCDRRLNGGARLVPIARQNIKGIFQAKVLTRQSADVLLRLPELNRNNSDNVALPASRDSDRPNRHAN